MRTGEADPRRVRRERRRAQGVNRASMREAAQNRELALIFDDLAAHDIRIEDGPGPGGIDHRRQAAHPLRVGGPSKGFRSEARRGRQHPLDHRDPPRGGTTRHRDQALQGTGRDGRRAVVGDHDAPRGPHAHQGDLGCGEPGGRALLHPHGRERRAATQVHREARARVKNLDI